LYLYIFPQRLASKIAICYRQNQTQSCVNVTKPHTSLLRHYIKGLTDWLF